MTSLNTAEQRLVDLPDFEAPAIKQAPDDVDLFPITSDGRLTLEIKGGLLKDDRIIVSCIAETGSHKDASYTSPSLLITRDGSRVVNLPLSIIAFSLDQTITFKYEVERGGEKKDSASLVLNVLPIPLERLPMPRALDADEWGEGEVWDLTEGTHDRTIRLDTWSLIAPGQRVSLLLSGEKADGSSWWSIVLASYKDNAAPWGNAAYLDVKAPFQDLKHVRNGSRVTLEFKVHFDQIWNSPKEVSFPVRAYTVMTNELAAPEILSVTDSKGVKIPDGGRTKDPLLTMWVAGERDETFNIYDGTNFVTGSDFYDDGTWSGPPQKPFSEGDHSIRVVVKYGLKLESKTWGFTIEPPSKT